ncbi:MAG: DNA repair protein RecO [Saprospiraceae bacterium]|nr:DNA repair protein RecO [Saprospiraceae bacterium]
MMLKTRGIVLRSFKYGETSIIAEIFTEAQGIKRYIIAGVRAKKSKVSAGLLQVMSLVEIVAYDRDDRDLNRLKEIKAAYIYQQIPFDVKRSGVGLFLIEVTQKCIKQTEQNEALFDFLYQTFLWLDASPYSIANIHLCFLIKLSEFLGFVPSGAYTETTPFFDLQEGNFVASIPFKYALDQPTSQLLAQLCATPVERSHELMMSKVARTRLLHTLLTYYQLHLEHFAEIQAHLILKEIFN